MGRVEVGASVPEDAQSDFWIGFLVIGMAVGRICCTEGNAVCV